MAHARPHTRRIVAAGLVSAVAVTLTASSSGSSGSGGGGGDGEILLWTHNGGNEAELAVNEQIVEDFNASQDEYTVSIQSFPQDSYNSSVTAAATSDKLPCVLDVDGPNVANWAWAGYLAPLELPEETFDGQLPGTVGRVDDQVYSYGHYDVTEAMYTRKSVLEQVGARIPTVDEPWTKDELMDVLAKVDALGTFPYALDLGTGGSGEWIPYAYSPFLQSFGGDLVDRESNATAEGVLNGPEAIEWAEWMQGLVEDGYIQAKSGEDATADFINGQSAIMYSGSWSHDRATEAFGDDLVIMPPPDFGNGPKVGAGSWQWAISSGCDEIEGAQAYLEFAHQTDYFVQFSETLGLIPATEDAAAQTETYAAGGPGEVYRQIAEQYATVRPVTPAYPFISSVFQTAFQDIVAGGDPQQVLDQATSEIDADIQQNGNYDF